ncbi:MAG: hypothetical protein NTY35_04300 [Planctomycetota bacterium]|nr:hypothetical protein [Planctomycetota bacterium]
MTPTFAFAAAFLVTLVLLGVVAWSGMRAKRRVHIPAVGLTVLSLGVTIYYAYALGRVLDLKSAGIITPIHLTLARVATLSIVLTAALGLRTLFFQKTLRAHKWSARISLSLVVLAAITGIVMVSLAEPVQRP